jgi:hypothetical protein
MDKQRIERALIGFLVGGLMGLGMNYLGLLLFNKIASWLGRDPVQVTLMSGIPLAIIFGLSMAINMAHPPFGD